MNITRRTHFSISSQQHIINILNPFSISQDNKIYIFPHCSLQALLLILGSLCITLAKIAPVAQAAPADRISIQKAMRFLT